MNDFTEDLVNGIKKALGVDKASSALDTIGNAATKVKNAFMGTSPSAPSGGGADAGMVSEANKTFADKAAKTAAPKLKAPAGAAPGKKPSFKDGTDYVPKTGDAKLHKAEAVLKKEDADKYRDAKMKN